MINFLKFQSLAFIQFRKVYFWLLPVSFLANCSGVVTFCWINSINTRPTRILKIFYWAITTNFELWIANSFKVMCKLNWICILVALLQKELMYKPNFFVANYFALTHWWQHVLISWLETLLLILFEFPNSQDSYDFPTIFFLRYLFPDLY